MWTLVWVIVVLTAESGLAPLPEVRLPIREVPSPHGRYVLRIDAGRVARDRALPCRATLARQAESGALSAVWERTLVNDAAPAHAFVRDDGRFVVTLDEFRRGGARHALVIYGRQGELLRHFLLSDLLERDDWTHVRTSSREVDWLSGAQAGFVPGGDEFAIRLKWGRTVRIDLKRLAVVRTGADAAAWSVPADVVALLLGADGEGEAREAPSGEDGETADAAAAGPAEAAADAAAAEPATTIPDEGKPADEAAESPALDDAPVLAEAIEVPRPNPDAPTDYVSWINTQVPHEGESGAEAYAAAMAAFTPLADELADVYVAAREGDPDAILDPRLQEWLLANMPAITAFRRAAYSDHAGVTYVAPEDGSMLGVVLPHLGPMRSLARAVVYEGQLHAQTGAPADAAAAYLDAIHAGRQAGTGATLIEGLVSYAMQREASRALLDDVAAGRLDAANLGALADELDTAIVTPPTTRTLRFEHAASLDAVQRMYEPDPATGAYRLSDEYFARLASDAALGPEEAHRLKDEMQGVSYEETVEAIDAYWDGLSAAAELPFAAGQPVRAQVEAAARAPDANPFLRAMMPTISAAERVRALAETETRAARLVTRLRAYRLANGRYPDSLAAFAGRDFAVDPFTGQPFAYRVDGDDFVLYSFGADGADHGGLHDRRALEGDYVIWPRQP